MPLYASDAGRWTKCFAAPKFAAIVPPTPPSDAAREGTCAAWVAECVINGDAGTAADMIGRVHRNGWEVDREMAMHVQGYLDVVQGRGDTANAEVEAELFGGAVTMRIDNVQIIGDILYIDEFKYGHDVVEHINNAQLLTEAAGLLGYPAWRTAELSVYQPRSAHPAGVWRTDYQPRSSITEWAEYVRQVVAAAEAPEPYATPGVQCNNCPAASRCFALGRATYRVIDMIAERETYNLTDAELSVELGFLETADSMLRARANAIRAEAEGRIAAGRIVQGWGLASGQGQRRWRYGLDVTAAMLGVPVVEMSEAKPRSPASLEKEGVKVPVELTTRPTTAPKLKRISIGDVFK